MSASTVTPPAPASGDATTRRARRRSAALGVAAWVVGIGFCLPALWMVLTSFHAEADAATNPPSVAAALTLDGYRTFFGGGGRPDAVAAAGQLAGGIVLLDRPGPAARPA